MQDARAVANWLIDKAIKDGRPLTPLQVIKLVYFAHGWTLAYCSRALFRQPVEAWPLGPVIADVYHALKQYRANPIDHVIPGVAPAALSDEESSVLEGVYASYGSIDGVRLSTLTHHDGSPWQKTIKKRGRGTTIANALIEEHFQELKPVG